MTCAFLLKTPKSSAKNAKINTKNTIQTHIVFFREGKIFVWLKFKEYRILKKSIFFHFTLKKMG
jgi:hypothetical protein